MGVVDTIANEPVGIKNGMRNVPSKTVVIEKVTVIE
jgi:hypothetical protein